MTERVVCLGCGSEWNDDRLRQEKERNPHIISCCPEREMIPGVCCPQTGDPCFALECQNDNKCQGNT